MNLEHSFIQVQSFISQQKTDTQFYIVHEVLFDKKKHLEQFITQVQEQRSDAFESYRDTLDEKRFAEFIVVMETASTMPEIQEKIYSMVKLIHQHKGDYNGYKLKTAISEFQFGEEFDPFV